VPYRVGLIRKILPYFEVYWYIEQIQTIQGDPVKRIEIMDTTLRDGEQMQHVSYTPEEKLTIAQLLLSEVKVDRLEVTSARASSGEVESVSRITGWAEDAGFADALEILTFVDGKKSIDWAINVGIRRINLLTKGSLKHCEQQLKKTPEQHFTDIKKTVAYASEKGIDVNVYMEDFSGGIKYSPDYVYDMIDRFKSLPLKRIMLPDTLGLLNPFETFDYVKDIVNRYPDTHFDYHSHNDYGLGVANGLAAIKAGASGIHGTINGLGERAGNASLDELAVGIKDFFKMKTGINEKKLYKVSKFVETFSCQRMPINKPIYGSNVFIQTAGIHADGDKKGNLYSNPLIPERFGRTREYALGKLSGRSNLDFNLAKLGIELDNEKKGVLLSKIIELGDMKKTITMEDLPFLISDIFESQKVNDFSILNFSINTTFELKPAATVKCSFKDDIFEATASGDGGYDAFMNALKSIMKQIKIEIPNLTDYSIMIPPGGKTDALVQATITWEYRDDKNETYSDAITTRGVSSDQMMAAIEATVKMVNFVVANKKK
jgi:D-citramalate synthase